MNATAQLAIILAVLACGLAGWSLGGVPGAAAGVGCGVLFGAVRWRGRQLWSWLSLWRRRAQPIVLRVPITVVNDRAGGGIRYQDGVAAAAVQVLGRPHVPTLFTGSSSAATDNTVDISDLVPLLRQRLGLTADSLSVVTVGARRRSTGDYPRVYDTLIGTPPYAGRRETWLIARVAALHNVEALRWRTSVGSATVAAAQRIAASLREQGIRARVATVTDIVEMERRLGAAALDATRRRWRAVRDDNGWLTTYCYHPDDLTAATLAQAWTLRADGIMQNVTVFDDSTVTATVTVRTAQPPVAAPSMLLRTLPGEQATAIAAAVCGPRPELRGAHRGRPAGPLIVPVGPSGVLLGKADGGTRLMLPLDDPGESARVHIAAEDALAKRLVVRLAAAGDRITVHTNDVQRWGSVRMPDVFIRDRARPATGTTVSVTDGTVAPAPRPNTVISVGDPAARPPGPVDVLITQTGPAAMQVAAAGRVHPVQFELFRAENRYTCTDTILPAARHAGVELEPVD